MGVDILLFEDRIATPISVGSGEAMMNPAMIIDKYFCHRPKTSRSSFLNTLAKWVLESWVRSLAKNPLKKKKIPKSPMRAPKPARTPAKKEFCSPAIIKRTAVAGAAVNPKA